jgi:tRNA (uracil-5-)-methyltransferase
VEIDTNLCDIAKLNFERNGINNVVIYRDDSKNFCSTWKTKKRQLYSNINYETILVDPPRGGLDKMTLKLISQFQNIIYISCNPLESFYKEYESYLYLTHIIKKMALFDQFPYTNHIECGFYLIAKEK